MKIIPRITLTVLLSTVVFATSVPAVQSQHGTVGKPVLRPRRQTGVIRQAPRGEMTRPPQKTGKPPSSAGKGGEGGYTPPRTQRPPRGNKNPDTPKNPKNPKSPDGNGGSSHGGGDDVGKPPYDNEDTHHPPRDEHPRPHPRPRPRFPVDVVIPIGPGGSHDDDQGKDDKKKDKKQKDAKQKDEPEDAPVADAPPRPLKYDGRAYRRLADSLLSRGRIDAALRVMELLKEQEYYQYTGSFDDSTAEVSLPEPPDYTSLAVRVVAKEKKKGKKGETDVVEEASKKDKGKSKGKDGDVADAVGGSWEDSLEARADALLALEQEAASLRMIPAASRSKDQQKRLDLVEADLKRATDDVDVLLDGLSRDLGKKDPRVKNLRASERVASMLSQLPAGTVAIYTLTSDERFWTIVVSPLGRNAYSTPVRGEDLDRKVIAFRKVLVNPNQDPVPLARELYDVVLGKAKTDPAMITARTLLWSFDGVLRYVPVAALNDGQGYLVERYRNVVFNRASVDSLLDAPASKLSGVGLGVARQIGDYRPLPAVEEELEGIFAEGGTGTVPGKILLDTSFTEPALEQALQGGNPVVHIATHFQLSPTDADRSQLLLGDGSLLNVGEIRQIKGGFRGVDLLTLSACDTAAVGPSSDGREVECFGTIAQERGAKSVIASLWPVSDRSTSLLMQTFYRMRAASPGATKADLFRDAQVALLKGTASVPAAAPGSNRILVHETPETVPGQPTFTPDPNAPFAHPYYWAPFLMIGNFR